MIIWVYWGIRPEPLRGQNLHSDIVQDFYGLQALVYCWDPYAKLGPALRKIGVDWDVSHSSTHPPTALPPYGILSTLTIPIVIIFYGISLIPHKQVKSVDAFQLGGGKNTD
jgi:hypothetical protein